MTVFKYALRRGFTSWPALILNYLMPLILVVAGGEVIVDADAGAVSAGGIFLVAMFIMLGAFYMARSIQLDKMDGTIVRILAGPITMRSYLVQNFMAAMIPLAGLCLIVGFLGMAVHGWVFYFAMGLSLCYALLGATSIGLSFVWSCIFKDKEASFAVMSVLLSAISMVSGLFLPLAILPDFFRLFGAIFPAHWAARGMEAFIVYGMNAEFWLALLAMALFTVAFLLYGGKRRIV